MYRAHILFWPLVVSLATVVGFSRSVAAGDCDRPVSSAGERVGSARDSQANAKIIAALEQTASFKFEATPLKDVAEFLGTKHQIPIVLDRKALDVIGFGDDTPITKSLDGITLRSALRLMLKDLDLTYSVRGEVLLITTPEDVEANLPTYIYDVADLVLPCHTSLVVGNDPADFDSLIDLITATIAPNSWDEVGGPGQVMSYGVGGRYALIVRVPDDVQDQIAELLDSLRKLPRMDEKKSAGEKSEAENETSSYVRIYPIADRTTATAADLERLVQMTLGPEIFDSKQGTFVAGIAGTIVVKHNRSVHDQTRRLLADLNVSP